MKNLFLFLFALSLFSTLSISVNTYAQTTTDDDRFQPHSVPPAPPSPWDACKGTPMYLCEGVCDLDPGTRAPNLQFAVMGCSPVPAEGLRLLYDRCRHETHDGRVTNSEGLPATALNACRPF